MIHPDGSALGVGRRWGHGAASVHRVSEVVHTRCDGEGAPAGVRASVPAAASQSAGTSAAGRRGGEVEEWRSDERERQRRRRKAAKGGTCHEPASDSKYAEVLAKL